MTVPVTELSQKRTKTSTRMTRRGFGFLGVAAIVGGAVFAARWFNVTAQAGGEGTLSAPDAHKAAVAGNVLLVDIRRPDEWSRSGVGAGAVTLDMRRPDFAEALLLITNGQTDMPVALICARGVRSKAMSRRLSKVGFSNIIDVSEGMLGSGAGPGWLKRGLPTVVWQDG